MPRKSAGKTTDAKTGKAVNHVPLTVNSFLDSLPNSIIFSLDTRYRYTAFSEAHSATMKKIWGVSIARGMNMLEAISNKKDRNRAKKNFDKALKGEHFVRKEEYGDPHHFRTTYEDRYGPIKNKSGKITGLYVWVVDLTAYRKTESEVKHYSALLSSSLESVNHGILVVDLKERVIFRNKKFLELWRIPPEIAKSDDDWKILGHALKLIADSKTFLDRVKKLYQNPTEESTEQIELKDGRVLTRYTRPHYLGKEIIGRVWSFRDSTKRVTQERSLIEWKNRHELIVSSFGRIIYDYDVTSGKILWSGKITEVLGFTREEMPDFNGWAEFLHPDDREEAIRLLDEARDKVSRYDTTYRFQTKSNGYVWLKDVGFFLGDKNGKATRMLGEMRDISEQVEADREIRHLASFPLHYPEIIIEISKDGTLTYGNPAFYEAIRRLGLTDHQAFIPPEFKAVMQPGSQRKTTTEIQVKGRTFNEKIFYLPEKNLLRIYAFDLTDRLEAERQKADLEHTYRNLFESATDSIMILDSEEIPGKIISANAASAKLYGYTLTELLTLRIHDLDVITNTDQITYEERANLIKKEKRQVFEVTHRKKDGTVFPLEVVVSRFNLSGKELELVFMRDITQRKKAEEELQRQYKFIESLAAASPDVVYVYDIDLDRYVYGNQRMADAYGYTLHELLSRGHQMMFEVLHPEDAEKIPEWIDQLKKANDGEVIESQFRLKKGDGTWRTFRSRESVFLRNVQGKLKQFIGTSLDITEQVAAEEALRESEQRFRALHEASFGGIGIHDMGKIIECNAGLSRLTGYSQEELIGMNGWALIHPDDHAFVLEKIKSDFEIPYDVRGVRKDGSVYALEIVGKAIPYQGKQMRVTELRDITERVKITEKIKEQNDRLQAIAEDLKFKNEQLDEFTQIVSHNLRAPAGNIVSLSDFLMTEQSQDERNQTLKLLKQSGNNILNTLAELNEVLKIKQSKNIEKRLLEFETIFVRTCQMLNAHITNMGARVERNFDEAPSMEYPHIYLESIFLNLLSNALKYSDPSRVASIRFKTYYQNGRIVLEVADNGLGINLERYGHQIFKMRKTFHNHPDSRGIGLFMIKNQVEAMGGQISLTSTEKEGTTFRIIF